MHLILIPEYSYRKKKCSLVAYNVPETTRSNALPYSSIKFDVYYVLQFDRSGERST